jgi:Uri superfamily endonuclease
VNACCDAPHEWRSEPGSYLLLLALAAPASLKIGRLGCRAFQPGRYIYVGSALGPGGLAARLKRHLRVDKRTHWHIDYLTPVARIVAIGSVYGVDRRECTWAHALQGLDGATTPVNGFGSSDCRSGCAAHLWRLPDGLPLSWIEDKLTQCPIQAI